jgi:hypothetical protein
MTPQDAARIVQLISDAWGAFDDEAREVWVQALTSWDDAESAEVAVIELASERESWQPVLGVVLERYRSVHGQVVRESLPEPGRVVPTGKAAMERLTSQLYAQGLRGAALARAVLDATSTGEVSSDEAQEAV